MYITYVNFSIKSILKPLCIKTILICFVVINHQLYQTVFRKINTTLSFIILLIFWILLYVSWRLLIKKRKMNLKAGKHVEVHPELYLLYNRNGCIYSFNVKICIQFTSFTIFNEFTKSCKSVWRLVIFFKACGLPVEIKY